MAPGPHRQILIHFQAIPTETALITGLEDWLNLGLMAPENLALTVQARGVATAQTSLNIQVDLPPTALLQGLVAWRDLGLLHQSSITGQVAVAADHPALLQGLERWVKLHLLGDTVVKQLCREHLTCPLPPVVVPQPQIGPTPVPIGPTPAVHRKIAVPAAVTTGETTDDWLIPPAPRPPNRLQLLMNSLMAELSVIWLLLLGVFVTSSPANPCGSSGSFPISRLRVAASQASQRISLHSQRTVVQPSCKPVSRC